MTESVRLSHSAITQLAACPRKIYFQKELSLYPETGSIAMRYGSGFHAGMEGYYKHGKSLLKGIEAAAAFWNAPTKQVYYDDYRNLESLLTAITLYHEQYGNDTETIMGVPEGKSETLLPMTDEEKEVYGDIQALFVAVIDLILSVDGMPWVVDFKTTSVELAYMASRLRKMPQLMGYQFVEQARQNIAGCMVYYHQLKATKSRTTGLYGATKTNFMKFPMIFGHQDYENWRRYVNWNAFCLKNAVKADYPPNFNSCYAFNSSCEYLPLCDYPKWNPDRFVEMDGFVVIPDERK